MLEQHILAVFSRFFLLNSSTWHIITLEKQAFCHHDFLGKNILPTHSLTVMVSTHKEKKYKSRIAVHYFLWSHLAFLFLCPIYCSHMEKKVEFKEPVEHGEYKGSPQQQQQQQQQQRHEQNKKKVDQQKEEKEEKEEEASEVSAMDEETYKTFLAQDLKWQGAEVDARQHLSHREAHQEYRSELTRAITRYQVRQGREERRREKREERREMVDVME